MKMVWHRFTGIFLSTLILTAKPALAQVRINEFVVNPNPEWVEFYNASDSAEYIKNYWLDDDENFTDDSGSSAKKILTNLNITNIHYPLIELNSFLNNGGDWVVLFDTLGNKIDTYQYTAFPGDNVATGRSPDNSGNFYILEEVTPGRSNAQILASPSPDPSPDPSEEPEPSQSPIPSPAASKTPSPTPKASPSPSPEEEVVNESPSEEIIEESPQILGASDSAKPASPYRVAIVLIGLGLALIGGSIWGIMKHGKVAKS